jgi:DNA-binding MarR family transcriptional regulator
MGYRVKVLSMLLSRSLQQSLERYDLTSFHWLVLNCLWREDGLPVSTIGEKLQQVGGTMTGVLDRMERRGLIVRERDLEDRRVWRIWLTQKAKELGKTLPPIIRQSRSKLYQGIDAADFDIFMSVLEQLIENAAILAEETKATASD